MLRLCRWFALAAIVLAPLSAPAQTVICPTVVAYAPPVVAYAPPPVVAYAPPAVSYYAPPVVTYAPPAVSYYAAPAPVSVSTYRRGLFGRRSVTTVNYGYAAPAYTAPVVVPRRAYYYSPRVIYYP